MIARTAPQQPDPVMPLLLTATDICELLHMSRRWLHRAVSAGQFPRPLKIGRASRWRRDDVLTFVENLEP